MFCTIWYAGLVELPGFETVSFKGFPQLNPRQFLKTTVPRIIKKKISKHMHIVDRCHLRMKASLSISYHTGMPLARCCLRQHTCVASSKLTKFFRIFQKKSTSLFEGRNLKSTLCGYLLQNDCGFTHTLNNICQ